MSKSYQPDLHEPYFPNGLPEIYVHVNSADTGSTNFDWARCSGDQMHGDFSAYSFDQNSNTWTGSVQLASQSDLEDKQFNIAVFEDDADPCNGYNNLTPKDDPTEWASLAGVPVAAYIWWNQVGQICTSAFPPPSQYWVACASIAGVAVAFWDFYSSTVNDDFIGVASIPDCFPTPSGTYRVNLYDENAQYTGAYLEINGGAADRQLCDLEAYPSGPQEVLACPAGLSPPGDYIANVSGGDESETPTYEWWEDNTLRGTDATYSIYNENAGQRKLKLKVTRTGVTAADSVYVTISEPDDPEQECMW